MRGAGAKLVGVSQDKKRYHLERIRYGDTWTGPQLKLPDMGGWRGPNGTSGPSDLDDPIEVTAQIKPSPNSDASVQIDVEVVDAAQRIVALSLSAEQTRSPYCEGYWDLQVKDPSQDPEWEQTIIGGDAPRSRSITSSA